MEENILQSILTLTQARNIDHAIINQAEKSFTEFKNQNPSHLIKILVSIAQQHLNQNVFLFVVNELMNLSSFFHLIDEIQRGELQLKLFQMLEDTKSDIHRCLLCDYICFITKQREIDISSHLIEYIWKIFYSEEIILYESAFQILAVMFNGNEGLFKSKQKDLLILFKNGLQISNSKVQVACIKASCQYLCLVDSKKAKQMSNLIPLMTECFLEQLQKDQEKATSIIIEFCEIANSQPHLFKKSYEQIFSVIWGIYENPKNFDSQLQQSSLSFICKIFKESRIIKRSPIYINKLFEMIFIYMAQIDKDIVEEWSQEQNSDFQEDLRFEKVNYGMEQINLIFENETEVEIFFPFLLRLIKKLFQEQDWRSHFVSLMAISQVIEYCIDTDQQVQLLQSAINYHNNQNPILRYAVFRIIGLSADSMKFSLGMKCQIKIIILKHLDDPCPQVISHTAAAIYNFIESIGTEDEDEGEEFYYQIGISQQKETFIKSLLNKLLKLINSDCQFIQESCIDALGSLSQLFESKLSPYYQEFIPILFRIFSINKGKQYSKLIGLTIECLTIISCSVEYQIFLPHIQELALILISVQNTINNTQQENKVYVISGWNRIIFLYSKELISFLPQIFPGLFLLIEDILSNHKDKGNIEDKTIKSVIEMIQIFIQNFEKILLPFIEKIVELLDLVSQFDNIESVKKIKSNCISMLVTCSSGNRGTSQILARQLLKTLHYSYNQKAIGVLGENMVDMGNCIIKIGNFLTQQEISGLIEIIQNIFSPSKMDQVEIQGEEKSKHDEDQNKMMEIENEEEDGDNQSEGEKEKDDRFSEVFDETSDLIEALFKTHKEQSLNFAEELYSEVLVKILDETASKKQNRLGLFIMDNMIEFLGYEFIKDKFDYFINRIEHFAFNELQLIRQPAIYAIGILATQTPTTVFSPFLEGFVQLLQSIFHLPQMDENDKDYEYARENTISSIGKIIKHHSAYQEEILNFWLFNLPLKIDKSEAFLQHEFLAQLVISDPDIFSEEMMNQVIKIFSEILETDLINKSGTKLVNQAYKNLQKHPYVSSNLQTILLNYSKNKKKLLEKALLFEE